MNKVYCDKCGESFKIKIQIERIEDDKNYIERFFFICPYCKTEYTSYYLNDDIKAKQRRMKIIQYNMREATKSFDSYQMTKLIDTSKKLNKEIGRDMNNLKVKIENAKER